VNVDEEVEKLDRTLERIRKSRAALQAQMDVPGYASKVPEKVRQQNDDKARGPLPPSGVNR
jgi:hypothetical protein